MKTRDELARLAEQAHDGWCMENEDRDPWSSDAWKHVAAAILSCDTEWLRRIRDIAILFMGEADPNYKDQWETGHDAGRNAAGRQLSNLLDSMGVPK